jgi:signal transduction histidine kinase
VPTSLAEFTAELASGFRSAVERAGMRLIVDCPALDEPVYVDRDMYEKVVLNLISNAFKFTLEGEIEVRLHDAGSAVELSVRDTGSGIAHEQLPHIFERFHRIEGAPARTHEGTGIGLALVEQLVKLHGGSVSVGSVPGQGSTFTVSIPKGKAHLPAARIGPAHEPTSTALQARRYVEEALSWLPSDAATASPSLAANNTDVAPLGARSMESAGRARIVWADDNADMRDYVKRLLAPWYDVETAHNGESALACARREPPELVLADVMMPVLDGFGLLHALRADERTREVPFILLSARAGEEARVEGMQAGADDYLTKPFSARELLARVDAHIKLSRQRARATEALRASEMRLRTVIDQLPAGVGVMDRNGTWTLSNSVMQRYMPAAIPSTLPDRVANWNAWDEHGNPVEPENWPGKRALRGETVMPGIEMLYTDTAGHEHWVRVSAAPLRDADGDVIGGCAVVQDITKLKSAEQVLPETDLRKDEFLATLAHELRNPLAPIRNGLHTFGSPVQTVRLQSAHATFSSDRSITWSASSTTSWRSRESRAARSSCVRNPSNSPQCCATPSKRAARSSKRRAITSQPACQLSR